MVHYLRLALKSNFIEYVELMDYPHVAGEAMLRWVVLVVRAHPVPPTVSVAWICRLYQSARSHKHILTRTPSGTDTLSFLDGGDGNSIGLFESLLLSSFSY